MPIDIENDATVTEAMERLAAAEAAEPAPPKEAFEQTETGELQQSEARSMEVGADKIPDSKTDDTRATADKAAAEATPKNETPKVEKQPDPNAKKASEFAKNAERLDKTWKAVNERKTQLDATETTVKQREAAIAQREQKAQLAEAKAKQRFTPEQYETAANAKNASIQQLELQAKGLDAQAEELEGNGEYGKAELAKKQAQDLREQAAGEKYSAKQLKEMADNLRKNPEPTLQQHQAKLEQHKKHYLIEASKVWPDVAKDGSEFQKKMAEHLQAVAQAGLDANENPVLFYHVARLTAAEATAARVPKLEKELGEAQAKVKELEALTAPGGGNGAIQKIEQVKTDLSDADEEAELRLQALARS